MAAREEREARKLIATHAERLATLVDTNPVDPAADVAVLALAGLAQCMAAIVALDEDGRVSAWDMVGVKQELEGRN